MPKVSIGLPVFDGENFLEAAIASILAQTFTDFELIISDNASTDRTEAICRAFAAKDARIRYVRQPQNRGGAWNFRHVFEISRGAYFKWAGHDDVIAPEFLMECVAVLDNDPGCVLVHPRSLMIDETGAVVRRYNDYLHCDSEVPGDRFARWMLHRDEEPNPVFGVIRRTVMEETRLIDDYIGSDRVFLSEVILRGRACQVPMDLFMRRHHSLMSHLVNQNSRDLIRWYTGRESRRLHFKYWRRLWEFGVGVRRSGISLGQKLRCHLILCSWMAARRRLLLKEAAVPLYQNNEPTRLGRFLSSAGNAVKRLAPWSAS